MQAIDFAGVFVFSVEIGTISGDLAVRGLIR